VVEIKEDPPSITQLHEGQCVAMGGHLTRDDPPAWMLGEGLTTRHRKESEMVEGRRMPVPLPPVSYFLSKKGRNPLKEAYGPHIFLCIVYTSMCLT